jgi:hypothetical protein
LYALLLTARVLTCCSLVATQRVSKSKNIIQGKCVACGSRFQFDDTHAVGNFIKKNPPTDEHSIATKYAAFTLLCGWISVQNVPQNVGHFSPRAVLRIGHASMHVEPALPLFRNATAATVTEREAKEQRKKDREAEKAEKKKAKKACCQYCKEWFWCAGAGCQVYWVHETGGERARFL